MFNQLIIIPCLLFLILYVFDLNKMKLDLESFPTLFEIIWQITFFIICDDMGFYWSHRILHWGKLYKKIHKIHHEFKITISFASEYAHPIEFILGNLFPQILGSIILGRRVHFFTYALYMADKLYKTTEGHSGYQFPWSYTTLLPFKIPADFHNFHHLKFTGNYSGHFSLWDEICGTVHSDYTKYINRNKKIN